MEINWELLDKALPIVIVAIILNAVFILIQTFRIIDPNVN